MFASLLQSFLMRREFFNSENNGYFTHAQKRETPARNPMTDPSMMTGQSVQGPVQPIISLHRNAPLTKLSCEIAS